MAWMAPGKFWKFEMHHTSEADDIQCHLAQPWENIDAAGTIGFPAFCRPDISELDDRFK